MNTLLAQLVQLVPHYRALLARKGEAGMLETLIAWVSLWEFQSVKQHEKALFRDYIQKSKLSTSDMLPHSLNNQLSCSSYYEF